MTDLSKLTPAQRNMVEAFKSDGRINANEIAKMKAAGINEEILQALKTEFPDTGELPKEPTIPNKKEKSFLQATREFVCYVGGCAVTGAVTGATIGGIASFFTGGAGAAAGAISGALCGAAVGLLSFLTSCNTEVSQNLHMDFDFSQLITALNNKEKADAERHKEIVKYLQALLDQGKDIKTIVATLIAQNTKLDKIIELLVINGEDNKEIIELLKAHGKSIGDIYAALGELKLDQEKQKELLKTLVNNSNIQIEYLDKILNLVKTNNSLQVKENEILNLVLDKISTLEQNDKEGANLLNAVLAQLSKLVEQEGDMDTKTHELLKIVINNQNKMDASIKQGFSNVVNYIAAGNQISQRILDKLNQVMPMLDDMNNINKAGFAAVLNAIKNLDLSHDTSGLEDKLDAILTEIVNGNTVNAAQLDELRKLIVENNTIAQGTQNAVNDLKGKMAENHKATLDKLSQGNASLDEISNLVNNIKAGVDNNTIQFTDINKQLSLIGAVVNNILVGVTGLKDETKAILLQILAKIPEGCTCTTLDLGEVLAKLNDILAELKKDPTDKEKDTNHEGILKDLEDYFS